MAEIDEGPNPCIFQAPMTISKSPKQRDGGSRGVRGASPGRRIRTLARIGLFAVKTAFSKYYGIQISCMEKGEDR
ncbi:MAG TPA: hypothetical protein DDZ83_04605 [Nitrospinae bacterium]|nr:hypothetical protein [Nitrospinota bacterium]